MSFTFEQAITFSLWALFIILFIVNFIKEFYFEKKYDAKSDKGKRVKICYRAFIEAITIHIGILVIILMFLRHNVLPMILMLIGVILLVYIIAIANCFKHLINLDYTLYDDLIDNEDAEDRKE